MGSVQSVDTIQCTSFKARAALAKSISVVSILTGFNIAISFLAQIVFATIFGTGSEMDAYLAASTIPTAIATILNGIYVQVLVPLIIEEQAHDSVTKAKQLITTVLNTTTVGLILLAVVGCLFAPAIVRWSVPGLAETSISPLIVDLQRIVFPSIVLLNIASLGSSIFYAQHKFLIPSLLPIMNTLCIVSITLLLQSSLGIYSVALGTLAGAIGQCALVAPQIVSSYQLRWHTINTTIRPFLKVAGPFLLVAIVAQAYPIMDRWIASQLSLGSISRLTYAKKMMTAVTTILSQGVSIPFLPLLSRYAIEGHHQEFARLLTRGIIILIAISLPVFLILGVFRVELIGLVLERGQFDHSATLAVAGIVLAYLGAALAQCICALQINALYAVKRTSTVAYIAAFGFVLYLVVAPILARVFSIYGIAMAFSLVTGLVALVLSLVLYWLGMLQGRHFCVGATKALGAGLLMTFVLVAIRLRLLMSLETPYSLGVALIGTGLALAVYFGALLLSGLEEGHIMKSKLLGLLERCFKSGNIVTRCGFSSNGSPPQPKREDIQKGVPALKYASVIDLNASNSNPYIPAAFVVRLVGRDKVVLDVGCANGRMSRLFAENGCDVWGVEINPVLANEAKRHCTRVVLGDIEEETTRAQIDKRFDVVIFADVLEHLVDPQQVLYKMGDFLTKDGYIVLVVPNVAFVSIRLRLLFGKFSYDPRGGILDTGHLRFFTLDSLKNMIDEAGYRIEAIFPIPYIKIYRLDERKLKGIPLARNILALLAWHLPAALARLHPSLFAYEFVLKISPKSSRHHRMDGRKHCFE